MRSSGHPPHEIGRVLLAAFGLFAVVLAVAVAWFLSVRRPPAAGRGPAARGRAYAAFAEVPGAYPAPAWQPGFRPYFRPVRTASGHTTRRRE